MAIEFELKFRAEEAAQQAIQEAFPQNHTPYKMETTYYDTPSGALSDRHYTLRCRKENGVGVCTLKTPAANGGRLELELNCENIHDAIPGLCAAGAPEDFAHLVREGLIAVCGARFDRTAILLHLEECTVEIALDKGILKGGDRSCPLCEVEVELKDGDRNAAIAFSIDLACRYNLTPESHSKFRRALALYKGDTL